MSMYIYQLCYQHSCGDPAATTVPLNFPFENNEKDASKLMQNTFDIPL